MGGNCHHMGTRPLRSYFTGNFAAMKIHSYQFAARFRRDYHAAFSRKENNAMWARIIAEINRANHLWYRDIGNGEAVSATVIGAHRW